MMPWEREIYLEMMIKQIEKENEEAKQAAKAAK